MVFDAAAGHPPSEVERLGRYTLLAPLGQGGMGTLHLAIASGIGEFRKLVVVKELRRDLVLNGGFLEMFMSEARLAARMNHPNIVQTLEAGQDGGRYFMALEFLDGQPLNEALKLTEPRLPLAVRLQLLCEVLAGLHYAHELCDFDDVPLGIVHRDINPDNVFVTYHGQVKVLDFGIAKAADTDHSTHAGVFKGRFAYAAPEQVLGANVDRRADVFSVGVLLWEVLAERRFAPGQASKTMVDARLAGGEPRILSVMPHIPLELAHICDRALQVDPALRYQSAEQFRSELWAHLVSRASPLQPGQLGELIRNRFGARRAAMYRAIRASAKHLSMLEDIDGSIVRALITTRPPAPAPDETTPVANLSPWIEKSRVDNPIAFPKPQPHLQPLPAPAPTRTSVPAGWLLLTAALLGALFYLWRHAERPRAADLPQPPAANVPAQAALAPSVPPAPAPPPPAADLGPGPETRSARQAARRAARRAAAAVHGPGVAQSESSDVPVGPSTTRAAAQSRDPIEPPRVAPPSRAKSVRVGEDLTQRRPLQRGIDRENPFE